MIYYLQFSVLGHIQLREILDRTGKELAHFPGAIQSGWLYQFRGGAREEGLTAPPFLLFCLFKL